VAKDIAVIRKALTPALSRFAGEGALAIGRKIWEIRRPEHG